MFIALLIVLSSCINTIKITDTQIENVIDKEGKQGLISFCKENLKENTQVIFHSKNTQVEGKIADLELFSNHIPGNPDADMYTMEEISLKKNRSSLEKLFSYTSSNNKYTLVVYTEKNN